MSDLSMPKCEKCGQPEYRCGCRDGLCCECGEPLSEEALECGREVCFACYCECQG